MYGKKFKASCERSKLIENLKNPASTNLLRSESYTQANSALSFLPTISKKNQENYPRNAFERKKKRPD